jgi:O-antigen/teichoic acid export membrane protein
MLAIFRPEEEVGVYNAAFRTARQAILLLPALNAAVSPWVAPLLAQGKLEDLARLYKNSTAWSLAAGWSATLLFVVFAKDFLGLFGGAYLAGTNVLVILALGQLVNSAVGNAGVVLQFSGNEKKELANGLVVTGLNVVLNCTLIPPFGPLGAAVATLLSLSLVAVRRLFQVRRLLGVFPYDRRTLFVLGGGVAATLVAIALRTLVVALGAGAPVAVAAAVLGMGATWALLLRTAGVTSEEAALLRLPKSWVREEPAR